MSAVPGRWRALAVRLARHAAHIMPDAGSPWGEAMRRELDYIEDDPAALRWALGSVLASYRTRMTRRRLFSVPDAWRQVAACGVLMLLIGLAFQDNAGGQTEPPRPAVDETRCDLPDGSGEIRPNGTARIGRNNDSPDAAGSRSDCADPHPPKIPGTPRGR
jgi:hypothetical protein